MKFLGHVKRFAKDESGMTLIDLSIFLIVIGLLTMPMIRSYDAWKYSQAKSNTVNNQTAINKAIDDYYYENRNYPCPARIDAQLGDADYGRADTSVGCVNTALPGNVHVGAVPFVTLKIPAKTALDGWAHRINYTVSGLLIAAPPIPTTPATNITLERYTPDCRGTENAPLLDVHFLLISTGPKGVGGRTQDGTLIEACPAGATPPLEAENCDGDLVFRGDTCARSEKADQTYYDDVVYADTTAPSRIWVYSTATPPDATDIVSTVPQIGINNPDAFGVDAQPGVDVRGNILTGDGVLPSAIVTDNMCDTDGNNCFGPTLIGGPATSMNDCSNPLNGNNFMRGVWGGTESTDTRSGARTRCQRSLVPSTSNVCVSPQYAIGFSGGRIQCGP